MDRRGRERVGPGRQLRAAVGAALVARGVAQNFLHESAGSNASARSLLATGVEAQQTPTLYAICPDNVADPERCRAHRTPRSLDANGEPTVIRDPKAAPVSFLNRRHVNNLGGAMGFSYGPLPTSEAWPAGFPSDDMTAYFYQGQWDPDARDDLGTMARMGARMVRLYGKDPREPSDGFLDVANMYNLRIIAGISEWPYYNQYDGCDFSRLQSRDPEPTPQVGDPDDFNCYTSIAGWYDQLMTDGRFMYTDADGNNLYHPALDTMIIHNEPELKYQVSSNNLRSQNWMKNVLSAFDGILSVELSKGMDIMGENMIRFTVAFSYGLCLGCRGYRQLKDVADMTCCQVCSKAGDRPGAPSCNAPQFEGIGEHMQCDPREAPNDKNTCPGMAPMMDLHMAFEDPSSVGYEFQTDGWYEAYKLRWSHSVNAFVDAESFRIQFLEVYEDMAFNKNGNIADGFDPKEPDQMVPVVLGEYGNEELAKNPFMLEEDLITARQIANDLPYFMGFNFFQFAVAYWKSCPSQQEFETWHREFWRYAQDQGNEDQTWEEAWTELAEGGADVSTREQTWWPAMGAIGHIPPDCGERAFGMQAHGSKRVSTSNIRYPNTDPPVAFDVHCMESFLPGKTRAVANAYGGVPPDDSRCRAGADAAPLESHCMASRGMKLEDLEQVKNDVCREMRVDMTPSVLCEEGMPEICDGHGAIDWVFSKYVHLKFPNDETERMNACHMDGFAVYSPFPAREECILRQWDHTPTTADLALGMWHEADPGGGPAPPGPAPPGPAPPGPATPAPEEGGTPHPPPNPPAPPDPGAGASDQLPTAAPSGSSTVMAAVTGVGVLVVFAGLGAALAYAHISMFPPPQPTIEMARYGQ